VIPSLQAGGMERVISELAGHLCKKPELEVHMVLYGIKPELFYKVPDNLIIHKPLSIFNNRLRFFYTIGRLVYLRNTISKIFPDTLLSFGELWNSFVLLALWNLPYPVYISDRCSPARKFKSFFTLLRKVLYPKAKGVIAQTEKAKEIYETQFRNDNICVIGNPIRQIKGSIPIQKDKIILTVGRLIQSKHHDKLIEVFSKITAPGWRLVIVGDDALKQKNFVRLNKLVHNLKMDGKIILTGKQSDIDNFYLRSQIFAFTSSSEGFPNVLGEAMSARLPVIAFDCIAGPAEMIRDNENGYLIPLFNWNMFKDKLELLIKNKSVRENLGKNAERSIERYSLSNICEKYYKFITEDK